jgi:predicted RNA-binding protein with PIN domain
MSLLIDGYNLLHASDVFPPASAPPTLEQSRRALLDFLVDHLPAKQLPRTIVTFDAVGAPPGLPREMTHRGLAVQFAPRGRTADELLEELIAAEPDPRNLLVISSDHRVQRAARQRGAKYIGSETWMGELYDHSRGVNEPEGLPEKPAIHLDNPFPLGYADDER